jgi:hypothetical protein
MVRFQKYDLIVMREIVRQTVAIMVVRGGLTLKIHKIQDHETMLVITNEIEFLI